LNGAALRVAFGNISLPAPTPLSRLTVTSMPLNRNLTIPPNDPQRELLRQLELFLIDFLNELPHLPNTDEDDHAHMQTICFELITFINNIFDLE